MKLKNEFIEVEVSHKGAELQSIIHKNIEYLWQGNSKYWKRRSPVLFPIVGRLLDNEYVYEGKTYHLTQHGFARDMDFSMIESSKDSVLYLLTETKESLKKYPFDFSLYVGYKLIGNSVEVSWKVVNASTKNMYFQIGGHPAFNFLNGSHIEVNKKTNKYELNQTPYVHDVISDIEVSNIIVDDTTFLNDAIIYDNIDEIVLKDSTKAVKLNCKDFPFIGLWSTVKDSKNAPFICLEPWHGIADCVFHDKDITKKKGINVLKHKETFKAKYTITLT